MIKSPDKLKMSSIQTNQGILKNVLLNVATLECFPDNSRRKPYIKQLILVVGSAPATQE